ncbi:methyltransferase [Rhodococcus sp. IEGM 1374]|uniref:methyltransferase n=1 Tax=Rhodococcus sp. IEGM 1374 TaxID=3082221 RepID=UPI002953E9AC|nr:methyltransferase [Rhodococcus sp. IEGM 1374]MDV7991599.1 methyltransferase [Rhodococcus sp. IEGM 1374]
MTSAESSSAIAQPALPGIEVEIRSLDQHQDPGFLHYRGAFYTHTAAARFAITQAAALSEVREVPAVAVSIVADAAQPAGTAVEFIGTPAELAGELASNSNYAPGVRRTVLPAPAQVTAVVAATLTRQPPPDIDLNRLDAVEVEVYSTRPDPLPNSRTEVGVYDHDTARGVAEQLAEQLGGEVAAMRGDTVLRVSHTAELSEVDQHAAARYTRVEELRANISALDPVADAEHITALAQDLDELRGRSPASVSTEHTGGLAAPVRPRGLVSAPSRLSADRPAIDAAAPRLSVPTAQTSIGRAADHGLG